MTTTLELIFSGLLVLSLPEGDGKAVVVFPEDDNHELNVVLVEGKADCGGGWITGSLTRYVAPGGDRGASSDFVLSMDYPHPPEEKEKLRWMSGAVGRVPTSESEAAYLTWLPSLSPMVAGDSRLRAGCRCEKSVCAPAYARFFLDRGLISSCHLVHDPKNSPGTVQLYELPYQGERAIADVIMVAEQVEVSEQDPLKLTLPGALCKLTPADQKIVVSVSYAPKARQRGHQHQASQAQDRGRSHFHLLHRLHRNPFQRMYRSKPQPRGTHMLEDKLMGACEHYLLSVHNTLYPTGQHDAVTKRAVAPSAVHSPTECGTASQP